MKTVVVDERIPKKCYDRLRKLGFAIISLPSFAALQKPVSAHPDMLLFFMDSKVFCHRDYTTVASDALGRINTLGYEICVSNEEISAKYPKDVLFNALRLGGKIYCRPDSVSRLIIDFAESQGIEVRGARQGYAKCSVTPVGERAAITSDAGLCRAMQEDGIDVLTISPGNIALSGYNTGFIGGCSGEYKDKIYFSGNIALHPDGDRIAEFSKKHGKEAISLSDEPLYDIGSMFFI